MALSPGTRFGPYEVVSAIGAGGMGEVYRARDPKLQRDVAIKVLPDLFAHDAERLARFSREAQTLAALNHPNIAQIFGIEEQASTRALVMELVEGEDLSQIVARGPIAPGDALPIARQIVDALEAAHEQGIVHRDLKPANIKVRGDGTAKVLDFGLAKAIDPTASSGSAVANSPTFTARATQMGMIVGTAAYMAPEQARGKPVDKRVDNWAFGCVLYEMLTGSRLFDGETVTDVLAAVVTRNPDWTKLPATTPPAVRRLLARCLDRDPRSRLRDIGEARVILADAGTPEPTTTTTSVPPRASGRWWIAAAAAALIAGAVIGRYALASAVPPAQAFEFDITTPGSAIETASFALSPDGSRLALVARDATGDRKLIVRDMNAAQGRVLPGTNGATYPFWSPDGREIAFFAANELNRIALDGAAPRPVATVTDPRGGSWGAGDVILIGSGSGPIKRVTASGGKAPEAATEVEKGVEDTHAWPAFLPDGKRFVFLADASTDTGHRIRLGSVDGGPTTILKTGVRSQPVLDPSGRLLLDERGQLLAYPFDLARGTLGDASTLVASPIYTVNNQHQVPASVVARGMLAFQTGTPETDLVVLDHAGHVSRTVGTPDRYGNVAVSPDGKRAAFEIFTDSKEKLVWVQDLERGVRTPVSQRGKSADSASWSPDNETVYFDSNVNEKWEVFRKSVTGGGEPENLGSPGVADVAVMDVSSDRRWLIVNGANGDKRFDLYLRSLDAAGKWTPWAVGPADEGFASFSPDSRWVVYTSDASGMTAVYVAPVEGGPTVHRWPISSGSGFEPRFSPDGKTIYYRSAASEWMAVDVRFTNEKLEAGTPKALFVLPSIDWPYMRNIMEVLPNGSGFMTVHPPSTAVTSIRIRTGK